MLEKYSALVRRLIAVTVLVRGSDSEPAKPQYPTVWPADRDEFNPDVTQTPLPMDLQDVVANLESMRVSLEANGSELAMSSFIWMVYPGMRLDLVRHRVLYEYLNRTYWPATYAHMRRMADYQNRVFESYAKHNGLIFLDVARAFPRDPDLFNDAIHMTQSGLRLQAWIYLQELIPVIQARIASGKWPTHASNLPLENIVSQPARLLSRQEILAGCH